MTYQEAEAYLNRLGLFGIKLGLEQVRELFDRLGAPDRHLRFLHIAGSNGKGSTAALLDAALRKAGYKVGFYSSPHLVSIRERFRINGRAIAEARFAALLTEVTAAAEAMHAAGRRPTYFEITTALAAEYFAAEKVDFVIWETGMGGRFDATNIVDPQCSVITGISLEHTEYLGNTIAAIAREKAGIIKPGRPVFYSMMQPEAETVIRQTAAACHSPAVRVPPPYYNLSDAVFDRESFCQTFTAGPYRLRLGLAGNIQQRNAVLAVTVLEYLADEFGFDLNPALTGFAAARWPGRIQRLAPGLLVDGAHNPEGAQILAATLRQFYPNESFTFIFGNFADKDTAAVLQQLYPLAAQFIFVPIHADRPCRSPQWLGELADRYGRIPWTTAADLNEATALPAAGKRVIAGSLYLAGEALTRFCPPEDIFDL
ncbi:MAG: bifunctional folylpolyglutamate synthase/dihydrofolate synthase [Victivallales bacterium]|nr:bifunctional folylpolyglutamate synthase/dihydrofolate synthase [Victivallales bacterium]